MCLCVCDIQLSFDDFGVEMCFSLYSIKALCIMLPGVLIQYLSRDICLSFELVFLVLAIVILMQMMMMMMASSTENSFA